MAQSCRETVSLGFALYTALSRDTLTWDHQIRIRNGFITGEPGLGLHKLQLVRQLPLRPELRLSYAISADFVCQDAGIHLLLACEQFSRQPR